MMCKTELSEKIISIVSEITEISREELFSKSRRSDVTEARCLAVYLLKHAGIRVYRIAEILGIPERSVYYDITSFSVRSDQDGSMLKIWFADAKCRLQKLRSNSEATPQ